MHAGRKALLHEAVLKLIETWRPKLGVTVGAYFLHRMKTKWGSGNHRAGNIGLNTELASKPKDLLEYVAVHEMAHLLAPRHSERFESIFDRHFPSWKDSRAELNNLPPAAEKWNA